MSSSEEFDINDYIIYFKTTCIKELKILFEIIQKLKQDSFMTFYKGTIEKPGLIEIKDTDSDQTILYKLIIPQQELKEYHCSKDVFTINLDFGLISKLLKTMNDYDEITFSILTCKEQELCITAYTKDRSIEMKSHINLSYMTKNPIGEFITNFTVKMTVNTTYFHTICKSLVTFGNFLNITCDKESLTLAVYDSEIAKSYHEVSLNSNQSEKNVINIQFTKEYLADNPMPVINSKYSLANIIHFDKLN